MQKKKYLVSRFTADEAAQLIGDKMKELGRDITNEEVNKLLSDYAIEQNKVLFTSEEPIDSDLLTGNLREEGYKVRNLNEEKRREDKDK